MPRIVPPIATNSAGGEEREHRKWMSRASKNTPQASVWENLAVLTNRGIPLNGQARELDCVRVGRGLPRWGPCELYCIGVLPHVGTRPLIGSTAGGVSALPLEEGPANHFCFCSKLTLFLRPGVG